LTAADDLALARYRGALHRATTFLPANAQRRVDVALEVAYQVGGERERGRAVLRVCKV
jgi:hypothetical protein